MIAPARRAAYRILLEIAGSDAHSDDLLHSPEVDALSAPDRNLTTTLVLGTLRWQIALDSRVQSLLARPNVKLSAEAATALRMGAFQLLHLDRVPAHAVLHDSVELVKQGSQRGASGMVNAILRRIGTQRRAPIPSQLHSAQDIAASLSHPTWMVERWARHYGLAAAESIARWDQEPAPIALRISSPEPDLSHLDLEPGWLLSSARRMQRGDLSSVASSVRVQDEASQLVAEIAAAVLPAAVRVLDACAAPGGKTAILAERLPQAAITAVDVSRRRLATMRHMLGARGSRIDFSAADAAELSLDPIHDLILCDVPCSGTGTLARNPEIRLRLSASDFARQHARQAAILSNVLLGLKPGGRLIYSTCSLEPEENEGVVEEVLQAHPDYRPVPVEPILDQLTAAGIVGPQGREHLRTAISGSWLRTIPGLHACEGFFAAVIARQ